MVISMSCFKFVCRKNEIADVHAALMNNRLVILHAQNDSGLSHFLKQMTQLLWKEGWACFYIDGHLRQSVANQIIGQIVKYSENDVPSKKVVQRLMKRNKKDSIIYSVMSSCLFSLDAIPMFPIGTILNSLISSLKETIDTDEIHINDYKTEKAVANLFGSIKGEYKGTILLFDSISEIKNDEWDFLSLLVERYSTKILFALNADCSRLCEMELISKVTERNANAEFVPKRLVSRFECPDDDLITALFECYHKTLDPQLLTLFEKYDRNIHVIMSSIYGIPVDPSDVPSRFRYALRVLSILDQPVPENLIIYILRKENLRSSEVDASNFKALLSEAEAKSYLAKEIRIYKNQDIPLYYLPKHMFVQGRITSGFAEEQKIINDTIDGIDMMLESNDLLTEDLLKFGILHLDHDYLHRKKYIVSLLLMQSHSGMMDTTFMNQLDYFDSIDELMYICRLYYNKGIYARPRQLLSMHTQYKKDIRYRVADALVCERLHTDDYVAKLEALFANADDADQKCLIATVLFVAYLNSDESDRYKQFFSPYSPCYYKQFSQSKNYFYLLRNVSYYIECKPEAVENYHICLEAFKGKDPVSYNRTVSNYLCYLMQNSNAYPGEDELQRIALESAAILTYKDPNYEYLNNNYGIYLMQYTDDDPTAFFDSIPYSTGTTETPYIYSKVNQALFYLRKDPAIALHTMDELSEHVRKTSVPRTKQFYAINRALIEYVNGKFPDEQLSFVLMHPLRGNKNYSQKLYDTYHKMKDKKMMPEKDKMRDLSLPGYLFYRYFDAKLLF